MKTANQSIDENEYYTRNSTITLKISRNAPAFKITYDTNQQA